MCCVIKNIFLNQRDKTGEQHHIEKINILKFSKAMLLTKKVLVQTERVIISVLKLLRCFSRKTINGKTDTVFKN